MRTPPPPPRAEKVRLEGSKDELTKKKENAKDESFLLICQRTQVFTVWKKLDLMQLPEVTARLPVNARFQLGFRAVSLSIAVCKSHPNEL